MIKKYPYNCTKSQVECYKFRAEGASYWADATIDTAPGAQYGRISISSDFGNWNYYWGACGEPFKKFLAGLDKHYVAKNFGADKFFDAKTTIASYRNQIAASIFDRKEVQATELEVNDLPETPHMQEFVDQVRKSPRIMAMYDGMPETCYRLDPGFENFWDHIWPLMLKMFKAEEALPQGHQPDTYNREDGIIAKVQLVEFTGTLSLPFLQDEKNNGKVFATGLVNEPILHTEPVRWIAIIGHAEDWSIYYHNQDQSLSFIQANGNKVTTERVIRQLVQCTDDAFARYRM